MIDEKYRVRIQQAERFYSGKTQDEFHDAIKKTWEGRAKIAQKLGEHLQSTALNNGKCTANIDLKTDYLLEELKQLGVDIKLQTLRVYILDIARITNLELILGDYRARLRNI